MAPKGVCSIAGCGKPVRSKGWCVTHYGRWFRQGDPETNLRPRRTRATCTIEGCEAPSINSRGWCSKHYQRWQSSGDPLVSKIDREGDGACSVEGCGRPSKAKRMCAMHYLRFKKGGSSDHLHDKHRRRARWIMEHAAHDGDDCLIWPFSVSDHGRGTVTLHGRHMSAPKAMCIAAHGEPPTGRHEAAHTCGKGHEGCMNPRHLRWATRRENEADKVVHGTIRRGAAINTARLTEEDVRCIRASSETGVVLAKRYGVTTSAISSIRLRRSWAWLE